MAISILEDFKNVNYAHNNVIFRFRSTEASDYADLTVTKKYPRNYSFSFKTKLHKVGSDFRIDLKNIVQKAFSSKSAFIDYGFPIGKEYNLNYSFSVLNIKIEVDTDIYSKDWFFVRAAEQLTESYDPRFYYLHEEAADLFEGYPFSICYSMHGLNAVDLIKYNRPNYSGYTRITAQHLNHTTGRGGVETIYAGLSEFRLREEAFVDGYNRFSIRPLNLLNHSFWAVDERFYINIWKHKPKDCKGLYVRWLNSMGGWSYHLFEKWEVARNLKTRGRFEKDYENLGVESTLFETGMDATDTLTLYSSHLEEYQKRRIDTLFDSPKVRLYTGKIGREENSWIDCYVGSKKVDLLSSDTVSYNVKVELIKPKKYILTL